MQRAPWSNSRLNMATIAIPVQRIERRMRGGTQALLVRDHAGNAYIAKCVGNPQGTRTLINEWIVSRLLNHLRVSTPAVAALRIERGIPGDSLLEFEMGNRKVPIASGVHLGSPCPVDPERRAIFDFLPRRLLHKVANLPDLLLSFAFDRWINQTDSRQAIFIRERSTGSDVKFRTYLIDHGLSFGGSRWEMSDSGLSGLYNDRSIYSDSALETECRAMVDRIQRLPEKSLFSIEEEIPPEWLEAGDREDLSGLLHLLCERRAKLHLIVERALRQLNQSGTVIPQSVHGRVLLGALLLLVCVPRTLRPTTTNVGIEFTATRNAAMTEAIKRGQLHLAADFDFTPEDPLQGAGRTYHLQIWRDGLSAEETGYFFRVYSGEAEAHNQLVGECAFRLDEKL